MGGRGDAVVDVMGEDYPDLVANHDFVRDVIDREEVRFRETLRTGQAILDEELAALAQGQPWSGDTAFLLHDTYGFPLEVTQEITSERGVDVDVDAFRIAMADQQTRAKQARKVKPGRDTVGLAALVEEHGETVFTGRAEITTEAQVLHVDARMIVLDRTPFYAESGGQVGDTGTIRTATGEARISDTLIAVPGLTVHTIESMSGTIDVGQQATATIDNDRRAAIRRNHTATHLLHWALREEIGRAHV